MARGHQTKRQGQQHSNRKSEKLREGNLAKTRGSARQSSHYMHGTTRRSSPLTSCQVQDWLLPDWLAADDVAHMASGAVAVQSGVNPEIIPRDLPNKRTTHVMALTTPVFQEAGYSICSSSDQPAGLSLSTTISRCSLVRLGPSTPQSPLARAGLCLIVFYLPETCLVQAPIRTHESPTLFWNYTLWNTTGPLWAAVGARQRGGRRTTRLLGDQRRVHCPRSGAK
jgi:hypothetical protein